MVFGQLVRPVQCCAGATRRRHHRHDQLAKYHPVPWLRWHNVSWHQVVRLPEGWASICPEIWSSDMKFLGKGWNRYTPSRTRFSIGLAYDRSKVSVKKSQIGFVHINFSRSIFPYMWNIYENGSMVRFAFWENRIFWSGSQIFLGRKIWNLIWNRSIWLGMSSY